MENQFFIPYNQVQSKTISQLVEMIINSKKIKLKDLKLYDLLFQKSSLTGIYVFANENDEIVYVGKSGSRSILERVASHLDFRANAMFNNFIRMVAKKKGLDRTDENLRLIFDEISEHKFLFVEFPSWGNEKKIINKLEATLCHEFNGQILNSLGRKTKLDSKMLISEII